MPGSAPQSDLAPVIAVLGPTGSGKSEVGIDIALRFGGEIVNCDSVQVYRYLDVGTAKLTRAERRGVPHHLLDVAEPEANFTAGEFARRGRPILRSITSAGKVPIVVGGTGFYLRALFEGLFEGPTRDQALRRCFDERERERGGLLHRLLRRLDPVSASRIHPKDVNKTVRALEVCVLTRQPLSTLWAEGRDSLRGFRPLRIILDPPREALNAKLDSRAAEMFEHGLVEEVRWILDRGCPPDSQALGSLGYRQAVEVLKGGLTIPEAVELTQRGTRRYAKRQRTWFRREPESHWVAGFGTDRTTISAIRNLAENYLRGFPTVFR